MQPRKQSKQVHINGISRLWVPANGRSRGIRYPAWIARISESHRQAQRAAMLGTGPTCRSHRARQYQYLCTFQEQSRVKRDALNPNNRRRISSSDNGHSKPEAVATTVGRQRVDCRATIAACCMRRCNAGGDPRLAVYLPALTGLHGHCVMSALPTSVAPGRFQCSGFACKYLPTIAAACPNFTFLGEQSIFSASRKS